MKQLILIFFTLFPLNSYSKTWNFDDELEVVEKKETKPQRRVSSLRKSTKRKKRPKGNLPDYAIYNGELGWGEIKGPISVIADDSYYIMKKVKAGDKFKLSLDNIVYAIEGKKVNVTGTVLSGELIGYNVVGHTILEPYAKKILIEFTGLVDEKGTEYNIKALAVRHGDQFFKPTKYISKKKKYLLGRVLAAFGASFLESKVSVNQTLLGQVPQNTLKNSGYRAGSEGIGVISNDFKDAMNNSKDVAYIARKMMYEIKFLNSPKTK